MLIIYGRNYCLCNDDWWETWNEESEKPRLGQTDGGEEWCHGVPRYHEGSADGRCVVLAFEFITERLVK